MVAAAIALACSSCGTSSGIAGNVGDSPSGELAIYVQRGAGVGPVVKSFRERYPDVAVHVVTYGDSDEAIACLEPGGVRADVIGLSTEDGLGALIDQERLQPLDPGRIDGWQDVSAAAKGFPEITSQGRLWMAPTEADITGLLYRPSGEPAPTSFRDLYSPSLKGKAAMPDRPVAAIGIAALALGYRDVANLSDDQLQNVKALFGDHENNFRTFWQTDAELAPLLRQQQIVVTPADLAQAKRAQRAGLTTRFLVAREGKLAWLRGYGLSIDAANVDAAYAFIAHALSADVQAEQARRRLTLAIRRATSGVATPAAGWMSTTDIETALLGAVPLTRPERYDTWIVAWAQAKKKGRG